MSSSPQRPRLGAFCANVREGGIPEAWILESVRVSCCMSKTTHVVLNVRWLSVVVSGENVWLKMSW